MEKTDWMMRLETFLGTVGASTPVEHSWVREARWLIDERPWRDEGSWREAEGAAPRRPGDDVSPEEAIRRIRGHDPSTTEGGET